MRLLVIARNAKERLGGILQGQELKNSLNREYKKPCLRKQNKKPGRQRDEKYPGLYIMDLIFVKTCMTLINILRICGSSSFQTFFIFHQGRTLDEELIILVKPDPLPMALKL